MVSKGQKWKKPLVLFLDFLFVFLSVFSGKITSLMMENLEGCKMYEKFGIKCLTCGGTRCVNAIANGKIKEAFLYNSFVPVALILIFLVLLLMNVSWIFDIQRVENVLKKLCCIKTVVICCSFVLIYMLFRNLYPLFCVLY
ncbi:MAG: DUF2752 domain-containing protein [Clostridia bacterium]|nr:DUF2752 domain-containing protein [Clostridia bacterium]